MPKPPTPLRRAWAALDDRRAFDAHVGSPDRTLTLYEGSYHETLNDLDRERVIGAMIDWIDHHCQPARD